MARSPAAAGFPVPGLEQSLLLLLGVKSLSLSCPPVLSWEESCLAWEQSLVIRYALSRDLPQKSASLVSMKKNLRPSFAFKQLLQIAHGISALPRVLLTPTSHVLEVG